MNDEKMRQAHNEPVEEKKSLSEVLGSKANEELSDQISGIMYDDEPMSEEGYNEMLRKWQDSDASASELPKIEKFSYSIRKGEEKETFIYVGKDDKAASYDPFAVYGIDDIDEETAIRNEMADFVITYVQDILEREGLELGYAHITNRLEATTEQVAKNDEVVSNLRQKAKEQEDFVCLKEKLQAVQKNAKHEHWAKVDYENEGDYFAGITYGTATEANIVLNELADPQAYVCQTRIFTGDNGFNKEEKRLNGEQLAAVLSNENAARSAWAEEMNAEPAIGPNRNAAMPKKDGEKPKSIRRID